MKRYLLIFIILLPPLCFLEAQEWWDGNICNIGSFSESFNFQTTHKISGGNEVVFTFTLRKQMYMTFSTRSISSNISNDTDVYLEGYSRDYTEYPSRNYFKQVLSSGTYKLIVSNWDYEKLTVAIDISGKYNDPASTFDIGYYNDEFTYSDTKNTTNYSDSYGSSTSDITYNFSTAKIFDISINTFGSSYQKTKAYLLNSSGMLIQDGSNGRIYYDDLPPSNYSVIVEGIECDMEISTTIAGTFPCPDGYSEIGEYDTSFIYSENEYMDGYPNLVGTELGDIVYKVTLKVPMIINVSHDGSVELHTAIHLWNVEMQEIGNNNSNTSDVPCSVSTQASMQIYLQKGVYYIVSESLEAYNDNYSRTIKTTIEGILPSEMLGDTAQNYIYTRTMTNKEGTSFMDKIQYFDGLGYPVELVERKASPSKHDIITYQEYDEYHRESKSWLPRVGTDGSGRFVALENFQTLSPEIYNGDTKAYAKPIYEESQLNRLVEQYGAGEDWHNQHKRIKTARMTNILGNDTLNCILFRVNNEYIKDTLLTLRADGNYESYQLFVTRTEDEDGNRIFEFKDKLGRLVLNRLMQGNEALDTYYIYNALNNPLIVLPPKAVELLVADIKTEWNSKNDIILQQYAYLYKYESSRRILCCAKKLPGCAWNFYLYDKNNHLIFTQDGNQRLRGEWVFTLPDISGRTCLTGICHNTFTFDTYNSPIRHLWIVAQRDASKFGYSVKDNIIELVNPTVLSVNFYDNYSCSTVCNLDNLELAYNSENSFDQRYYTDNAVDMLTGTLTGVLNESGEIYKYLGCMMYYDNRGRLIQMKSTDHLGYGIEKDYFAYNFIGQPLKQKHVHMAADKVTQIELYTYTYDHAGRLLTTTHELNDGGKIKLIDNMYDELGRLKCNKRNGHPDLKTDYTYNVRSWTKSITSPLFTQTLYYNDKRANQSNIASYNGNISAMDWKVATSEEKQRGYDFMYDGLSRLREATYLENGIRNDKFNTSYGYDKHGNIQTLVRYGNTGTTGTGIVDNLTLRYNGNQLVHVDDAGETTTLSMSMDFKQRSNADIQYYYDGNGNLVKDLNKGISDIKYNLLNLPEQIKFTSANNPVNSYVYSAGGKKLSVIHKSTTEKRTDYIGNMIYENGSLKRILVDGGYIENGVYHFYIQDHLGNNRVVAKSDGTVIQTNHYYPYGISFAEGTFVDKQPYKYNGKELDTENGLNLYDYDARQMDGVLGRFVGVDAHAENYYSWSPYVYVGGNPLKYIDPTGKDWFVNGETGDVHFFRGVTELNKLSNEQIKLAGINKDDLGSYEKLGGDDMIKIGSDIIASSNIGGVASKFMAYHGFVSADRVRVEETTTDYTYTEADGGQRVVSSTTTTQEVNRYKSYVRTHYIERQDNGTILGMTMNPTPGWNEGRYVDSRKLIISPGIQKSIKISDYKIPVGAPYSAPSQKTNVAPETKNNLIRIFLDIFNVIIN